MSSNPAEVPDIPTLLDALAASEARAEALKAQRDELTRSGLALMVDLKTAKDELSSFKARVAEVLGDLDAHLDFSIPVDAEGIVFDDTTGIDNAFRRAAELHTAVSGEQEHDR